MWKWSMFHKINRTVVDKKNLAWFRETNQIHYRCRLDDQGFQKSGLSSVKEIMGF